MTESKVVLITGAARRIGAVTAKLFHERLRLLFTIAAPASEADRLCEELNHIREDSCFMIQAT